MKLSVFTVSTPDMTPEQLTAAAKKAGIDGIEWRCKEVPDNVKGDKPSFWGNNLCTVSPSGGEKEWERFKSAADSEGLLTLSVTPYLIVGDLDATEEVLAAARYMGARYIRLAAPGYDRSTSYTELFAKEIAYLRQAVSLCKQYGVKGLIETHHVTIAASASAAYRLVEGFDPDHIGVLYDPGNMVYEGFENYRMGMELLGPYLAHVHVKNAAWGQTGISDDGAAAWGGSWSPIKQGMVPWKQVIEDLRAVQYDGYLGVEDFSGELGSEEMLQNFADYMRSL